LLVSYGKLQLQCSRKAFTAGCLLRCQLSTGNGFPIGGLVTSPSMAAAFAAGGMEYFNTYGECV
jgi:hypothetical protein